MNETSTHITPRRADDPQNASRCYLLFAGSLQGPRGGLADLVQTFPTPRPRATVPGPK